jgi:hypothetical protein
MYATDKVIWSPSGDVNEFSNSRFSYFGERSNSDGDIIVTTFRNYETCQETKIELCRSVNLPRSSN